MSCQEHPGHGHHHAAGCGHKTVQHEGHTDYLHDGHLHSVHGDHVDEHRLAVGATNPAACTPNRTWKEHSGNHVHGQGCGHEAIPHGDHIDYAVAGHLHHAHNGHCDDHGEVQIT